MKIKYIIECWNPDINKYEKFWEGYELRQAEIIFYKSYYQTRTRRLIKVIEEILYAEKAKK